MHREAEIAVNRGAPLSRDPPAEPGYRRGMRLNQITLGCTDFDASCAFYEAIGLIRIVDAPPRYARFETTTGETLSIHAMDAVVSTTIVYFEVDDVDAAVARLRARGIAVISPPADQPWLWQEARLADPAGNIICLYLAGENRRFPPWRIETKD
jgi:predicted enzyme related to lactoylglutathione lyase